MAIALCLLHHSEVDITAQMAEREKCPPRELQTWFDSSRVNTMTLKLAFIASLFDVQQSALTGQCGEQAGKFTCSAIGKALSGIPPF